MYTHKDLLGLEHLSKDQILYILDQAAQMKQLLKNQTKKTTHLQNKTTVNLFYENSTRTSGSFEMAAKIMGAVSCNMAVRNSSVNKGETLIDTGKTLDSMGFDIIVIRHGSSGAPHLLAQNVKASVINAGDGMHEHPTQALLDMLTIREKFGDFKGLKVAVIGDIKHSRVARSNIFGLSKLGAKISIAAPSTLMPQQTARLPVKVCSVTEAVDNADVVMGLRLQLERMQSGIVPSVAEYATYYGINDKLLLLASKNAVVLHPGPINRGVEISTSVADSQASLINEQVLSGVAVRMAVMNILIQGRNTANG